MQKVRATSRVVAALLLLYLGLAGCDSDSTEPAPTPLELPAEACVALFQVDFVHENLEGGVVRSFSAAGDSGSPFLYTSRAPGDFGWSLIRYAASSDTLFYGTTIWLGSGDRAVPRDLLPPSSFTTGSNSIALPDDREYFYSSNGGLDPVERQQAADSAWAAVSRLDLTREFATRQPHVALFLYSRREGLFDPSGADWMVLIYGAPRP
jgi:hypothetical protein